MFPPVATYNKLNALPTLMLLSYLYPDLLEKLKRQDNRMQIYFAVCGFFTNKKYFLPSQKIVVIVQSLSHVWLFATPWSVACQASLSFTISRSLLKFMFIGLVMLSNYCILCHGILLLPSIFPSIRVISNELALCITWSKYWSFSINISSSNE